MIASKHTICKMTQWIRSILENYTNQTFLFKGIGDRNMLLVKKHSEV